jgi:hypothetical protein
LEGVVDALAADMAVKEGSYLIAGESAGRGIQGFANAVDDGIGGGRNEKEGSAGGTIIPYGEGRLEVGQGDDRAAVEGRVDSAQAQDLGFRAAGSGAKECCTGVAQVGIVMVPKLTCVWVAGKGWVLRCAAYPVESAA